MTMMMMMQGVEAGENKVRRGYGGGSEGGGRKGFGLGEEGDGRREQVGGSKCLQLSQVRQQKK